MTKEYIQDIRYKLQKEFRKLNSTDSNLFHTMLIKFFNYINKNQIFKDILDELILKYPDIEIDKNNIPYCEIELLKDENTHAVASYLIIKACTEHQLNSVESSVGFNYCNGRENLDDGLERFKETFLETLYNYLDEKLDEQRSMLNIFRRYKHKCEWFKTEYLSNLVKNNSSSGEKKLAYHLYEHLYDQGVDFSIEPKSASGSPDLISQQNGKEPIIADTKIFDANGRGKGYIVKGFHQVYQYTKDYNESFGYLIIYKICEKDLKTPQYFTYNNKTIFIIIIDIFEYSETASGRGRLKATEISEEDFVEITEDELKPID